MTLSFKRIIQLLCYYTIPLGYFLYLIIKIFLGESVYFDVVSSGNIAMILIIGLLFVKPLSVITPIKFFKRALGYRREFGVLAFWFAVFHGVSLMVYLNVISPSSWPIIFDPSLNIIYGMVAFLGMVVLGLTSNRFATIKLKGNWKRVQRIAYPTLVLVIVHKALAEESLGPLVILVVFAGLKAAEIYTVRKRRASIAKPSS